MANKKYVNKTSYTTESNSDNINNLSNKMNSFCTDTNLYGTGWDEYRKLVENLIMPIKNIGMYSSDLSETISDLQKSIDNCLGKYNGNLKFPGKYSSDPSKAVTAVSEDIIQKNRELRNLRSRLKVVKKEYNVEFQRYDEYTVIDENVKAKIEIAEEELEDLKKFNNLLFNLVTIKNNFYPKFAEILGKIKSVKL